MAQTVGPFQLVGSLEPEHRFCSLRHDAFLAKGPSADVVVKQLQVPFVLSSELRAAWTYLMERLASLKPSPALAPVIGFGVVDGERPSPWYAMPFLDGEPLHRRIERGDRFSATETRRALECVVVAIDAAAEVGVQLIPDARHVMLHDGLACCWDAGVGTWFEVGARTSTLTGWTIRHQNLTPERARAEPPSGKGQCQALALLAFAMLTGDWYWKGDRDPHVSMMELLMETLGPIEPASARSSLVPRGFDDGFEACLSGELESPGTALEALCLAAR